MLVENEYSVTHRSDPARYTGFSETLSFVDRQRWRCAALPPAGLTFPRGDASRSVTVSIAGDTLDEPNETLFLNLGSPTNASIAKGHGVGTIADMPQEAPKLPFSFRWSGGSSPLLAGDSEGRSHSGRWTPAFLNWRCSTRTRFCSFRCYTATA
jgi:hypothetical protein